MTDPSSEGSGGGHHFADLFELAGDAMLLVEEDGRIGLANPAAEAMLGWTREELVGKEVGVLVPPSVRPRHEGLRSAYQAGPRGRMMAGDRQDLPVVRKDGSEFLGEISLAPMTFQGRPVVVAVVRDVTARRMAAREVEEAHAQLHDAVESISQGLVLYDAEDRIVLFNRRFQDFYPGPKEALCLGATFEETLRSAVEAGLPDAESLGRDTFIESRVANHRRADGQPVLRKLPDGRLLRLTETPAHGGGRVGVVTDVTQEALAEERLREVQRMEAIGKLTGGMAHDFNNYLSAIIGNLDLFAETESATEDGMELIREALAAAMRAAELSRSLLAYARRQPLAPRTVDLNELVTAAGTMLKRTLGSDVALRTELEPTLSTVEVDSAQMDSCLLNLANNARDASTQGDVITLRTYNAGADSLPPHLQPGEYVVLEVADTGSGMPSEVAARACEPFFTTKGPGHGSGLGLSMVFGFARQSGGDIQIDTRVGLGTTVRIFLPRAGDTVAPEPRPMPAEGRKGGGETILVVDDNDHVRRSVSTQLAALGYQVLEAADADAALSVLHERGATVDLLFTDVVMPGEMDGYGLAHLARRTHSHMCVLITSGFPGDLPRAPDDVAEPLPSLRKPYRSGELAAAVRSALDGG